MNTVAIAPVFIHSSIKRRKQTWYTVADGNWSNPNIWASNGRRRYSYPSFVLGGQTSNPGAMPQYPTANDDVFINHAVVIDVSATSSTSIIVNNMYVAGSLSMNNTSARGLTVVGDLQVNGSLDISGGAHILALYGVNNYINNFTSGTSSFVNYMRTGDQFIMDLSYRNLGFYQSGTKYLVNNLSIAGNLASQSLTLQSLSIECTSYNLTVSGTTATAGGIISKTGTGSILFIGQYSFNSGAIQGVSFTGNPLVEFRGGLSVNGGASAVWNTGTGTWSATTATQTWTFSTLTYLFTAPVSIVGAITLNEAGTGVMQLNQPIDCTSGSGSLVCKGIIYWNATASLPSMTTGTIDKTTNTNTVGYTMAGSITLPYTSYYSLVIGGSGSKTAAANLSLPGSLVVNLGGTLQLAGFDLTVALTTSNNGTISKTSSGSVLFTGLVTLGSASSLDLTGNPSLEFRGGLTLLGTSTWNGAVIMTFTTNNQSVTLGGTVNTVPYDILISGAITLTNAVSASGVLAITGLLYGNNAASTFDNRGTTQYQNTVQPMLTGILQTNAAANTFVYNKAGNQDITGGTYRTLTLAGSGVKTLQGNVVVVTLYTLTAPATLSLNGFTRT